MVLLWSLSNGHQQMLQQQRWMAAMQAADAFNDTFGRYSLS